MDTPPVQAWACGAALCALGFLALFPWREELAAGRRAHSGRHGAWLLPLALAAADLVLGLWPGGRRAPAWWTASVPASPETGHAAAGALDSLAETITGAWPGQGAALLAGVLVICNAGGCRRGLRKGLDSVFPGAADGAMAVLLAGWMVLAADLVFAPRGLPWAWHFIASLLGAPAVGAVCAAVTGCWLLLAETARVGPDEKRGEIRWLESAAAHAARLWPCAAAGALGWVLLRWLPGDVLFILRPAGWVLAVAGMFAPSVFLKLRTGASWREGVRESADGWRRGALPAAAWLIYAGVCFFLWRLGAEALRRAVPPSAAFPVVLLARAAHTWLAVTLLGGWMMMRPAPPPPPPSPPPRSRRRPKSSK